MERCPEIAALDDRTEALRDELRTRLKASLEALAGSLGATGDPL
jgi:hypothetical protein